MGTMSPAATARNPDAISVCFEVRRPVEENFGLTYTCYDQDEGVWKEEAGMLLAHMVQLVKHPKSDFEPRWTPVVSLEHLDHVEVKQFMEVLADGGNHQASSA